MSLDRLAFRTTGMRRLVAAFDWGATPLGPVSDWSPELRSQVQLCLDSDHPMLLALGDDLVQIYNDGYVPILADKHPAALGQSAMVTWSEIRDFAAPAIAELRMGKSLRQTDFPLVLKRNGKFSERHYTFAYSPLRGSDGLMSGVLSVASDTSARVWNDRRAATLDRLAETARPYASNDEVWEGAREALCAPGACAIAVADRSLPEPAAPDQNSLSGGHQREAADREGRHCASGTDTQAGYRRESCRLSPRSGADDAAPARLLQRSAERL